MDEQDLVKRLKAGEPRAVAELLNRYGRRLHTAAYILCSNWTDAEDLTMQTFVEAVRCIGTYREKSRFFTWLYGIFFNLARQEWRKPQQRIFRKRGELPNDLPQEGLAPVESHQIRNDDEELMRLVSTLSAPLREVVLLRYYSQMPLTEIAKILGIPPGTVKSRLHNATEVLREIVPPDLRKLK